MNVQTRKSRSRAGGRSARRTLRGTRDLAMLPGLMNRLPICEMMDRARVEKVDSASMYILENVGTVFRHATAIEGWRGAGAKWRHVHAVDTGQKVRN